MSTCVTDCILSFLQNCLIQFAASINFEYFVFIWVKRACYIICYVNVLESQTRIFVIDQGLLRQIETNGASCELVQCNASDAARRFWRVETDCLSKIWAGLGHILHIAMHCLTRLGHTHCNELSCHSFQTFLSNSLFPSNGEFGGLLAYSKSMMMMRIRMIMMMRRIIVNVMLRLIFDQH